MKNSSHHVFWLQILNYETCILRNTNACQSISLHPFTIEMNRYYLEWFSIQIPLFSTVIFEDAATATVEKERQKRGVGIRIKKKKKKYFFFWTWKIVKKGKKRPLTIGSGLGITYFQSYENFYLHKDLEYVLY